MRTFQHLIVTTALTSLILSGPVGAQDYDLVISNGPVMDPETFFDAVAHVGIKDGRITAISSDPLTGTEEIDATGFVVAPGFIDTHYHATDVFVTKMALRDGLTTGMDLEAGSWNVEQWCDDKAASGWQVNYGTVASLFYARMAVHDPEAGLSEPVDFSTIGPYIAREAGDGLAGWSLTKSSIDEMNQILAILDEDLRQGALGLGVPAPYMARGLLSYELFAAQRAAAPYGRLTSVHTRYHLNHDAPDEAPIAFDEIFTNAMLLDAPLLMAHNNDYGWWEIEEKLQLARDKGLNMWSEYYPYAAASTGVSANFFRPEKWVDEYGYRYEDTLYDLVADGYLTDEGYQTLIDTDPGRTVIAFKPYREAWMPYWLTVAHMTLASDAMAGVGADGTLQPWDADWSENRGHPRTSGTRGAAFRMARVQGVPPMFTIAQASYWSAKHLGDTGLKAMQERGRIQIGKIADLTIFDPEAITDNSGFKVGEHGIPTMGIPFVVVNSVVVVKDSDVLPATQRQPIRFPVEQKVWLEPIEIGRWLDANSIGLNPGLSRIDAHDGSGAGAVLNDDEENCALRHHGGGPLKRRENIHREADDEHYARSTVRQEPGTWRRLEQPCAGRAAWRGLLPAPQVRSRCAQLKSAPGT